MTFGSRNLVVIVIARAGEYLCDFANKTPSRNTVGLVGGWCPEPDNKNERMSAGCKLVPDSAAPQAPGPMTT